ncbi:MAG: secretin N-terminal domain-containing protein [Thermoguttaceae bacterium]
MATTLPLIVTVAQGDEFRPPIAPAAARVSPAPGYGDSRQVSRAATPVQRIASYTATGPQAGVRQASFTGAAAGGVEPVLRAYGCTPAQGSVLEAALSEQFGTQGNIRIVHDQRMSQLLVMAPEAIQQQIAAQMRSVAQLTAASQPPVSAQPVSGVGAAAGSVQRREYQLRHTTAARLQSVLGVALGVRWSPVPQPAGSPSAFRLLVGGNSSFLVRFDQGTNRLLLEGPGGKAYESCARLIESLDTPPSADEQSRCLVSLTSLPAEQLTETINAIHTTNGPAAPRRSSIGPNNILLAQAEGPLPPATGPVPGRNDEVTATVPLPGAGQSPAAGAGLTGPVQIEMLEGLDVLVIKGNKSDVQQVVDLIKQIEQMSQVTEPAVVIHPLTHVNCEALATLVTTLYSEVFSLRQGTVSITALVKPNALLLIGRPESVETVVTLVKQLDTPVPPESQFKVFRLRYAAAGTAQETIEEFFQDSEGEQLAALGARVRVLADVRSNSLIVRASSRDMLEVGHMIAEIDTRDAAAVNDLRVFKLKNSLAEDLEPILQNAINGQGTGQNQQQNAEEKTVGLRFVTIDSAGQKLLNSGILSDVRVTADPRANALLVSAPAESMPLIEALIAELDQLPVAEAQLKVFTIVNGDAAALVEMLESLFGQTTANQSEPPARTGASAGDSSLVSLRFATDVRTNSIIASGALGDLAVVEAILLRLDESDVKKRKTTVYRLKNAPAADVADAINQYLEDERTVREGQQDLFSTFEIFEQEVIVVAEDVSNSLIVSATPDYYEEIAQLVEQLDERPAMVMIQVLIAEVRLNDTEEFGIEVGLQDSILFDRSLLGNINTITNSTQQSIAGTTTTFTEEVITSATNEPGFLFNDLTSPLGNSGASNALRNANVVGSQGLSNFGVGRLNSELGFGGLVLSASSESVSMLLRALKEDRRINILSRPQIMTLDNQGANIQVGQRVPRVTGTATNESGGLTNQVTMEDVGLIVGVTPRISPDGLVVMEIDAEKSEVGPEAEGIPVSVSEGVVIRSPRIDTITASTTVSALDGQTVVLGGLITSNKTKVDRRVPFLSQIPVLGELFRYRGFTSERNELLIVLTPRIVNSEEDAQLMMQEEAARMDWCLNDVLELHEEVAFRPRNGQWRDNETDTIYPDGKAPAEGFEPLENSAPTDAPSPPAETPTPAPSMGASRYYSPSPAAGPGTAGSVAPANYESGIGDRGQAANKVYPAAGSYGTNGSPYPATAPYASTSGY